MTIGLSHRCDMPDRRIPMRVHHGVPPEQVVTDHDRSYPGPSVSRQAPPAGSSGVDAEPRNRFRAGIRYGAGIMSLRFPEFFPLLRGLGEPVGHIGVLGTHMFWYSQHDGRVVLNVHSTREMTRSFRCHIRIAQLLARLLTRPAPAADPWGRRPVGNGRCGRAFAGSKAAPLSILSGALCRWRSVLCST